MSDHKRDFWDEMPISIEDIIFSISIWYAFFFLTFQKYPITIVPILVTFIYYAFRHIYCLVDKRKKFSVLGVIILILYPLIPAIVLLYKYRI